MIYKIKFMHGNLYSEGEALFFGFLDHHQFENGYNFNPFYAKRYPYATDNDGLIYAQLKVTTHVSTI